MKEQFIVAEITKNWPDKTEVKDIIGQQFERVINVNFTRGYHLKEWKTYTLVHQGVYTETIIAIFELNNSQR